MVESGVSEYGNGAERLRQRGTAAHNTVVIDGQNSSEVWAGFRVGRRARVVESGQEPPRRWWAAHDGYRRLPGRPTHRRTWELVDRCLVITDEIQGQGRHSVEVGVLLHPDIIIGPPVDGVVRAQVDGRSVTIVLPEGLSWVCERAWWHSDFNVTIPTHRLCGRGAVHLPQRWAMRVQW